MNTLSKISKFGMPLVIAISIILGMYIQRNIDFRKFRGANSSLESTNKLDAVIDYVSKEYVDTVNIPQIIENTIPKVLEELDPHSVYIPAVDLQAMNEPLEGNFDGIGVQFNIQKDTVSVVKVIVGGPSEKVGIRDGDRIVKVNDSIIAKVGITNEKVMKLLRGKKGTKVKVAILRRDEANLIDFTIIRDEIPLYSVDVSYMIDDSTGYIKLSKFARTTYSEFLEAVAKLKAKGMKKLVFDLRGNSGGYMDAAVNIADEFLEEGKLIVYTEGKARPRTSYYSTQRASCVDLKLVVLIDEWSASASEIVSGAIQDNDRGQIIGRRSFGKGLVQEPVMFTDGSSIRLTIARYYTPSGRCIQKPYSDGQEKYYEDIHQRFINGEFEEKDSVPNNDTLKYYTTNGRVVYGGGGIMPDVFVPADTTGSSDYYTKLSRKGLEYQFCFDYTDIHRNSLSKFKTAQEIASYLDNQDILTQFVSYASEHGMPKDKQGLKLSGAIINSQIKALIARNILDNDGFYPIIQEIDKTLLEGIRLIEK